MGYRYRRVVAALILTSLILQILPYALSEGAVDGSGDTDTRDESIFKVALQDGMRTYNPLVVEDKWTWEVMKLMFDGLTWRNESNNSHIEPWAAEWFHHGPQSTWDTSVGYADNDNNADYRNWTVKLRDGIKWHDWKNQTGDDRFVRAHDVIFSLRMLADAPRYMWKAECIVARNPDGSMMYGRDLPENGTIRVISWDGERVRELPYWINLSFQKQYPDLPVIYAWESDNLTMHFFLTFDYVFFTWQTLETPIFPERIWKDHVDERFLWNDPKCLISFGICSFDHWDSQNNTGRVNVFRDYFHKEYDELGREKPYIDGIRFEVYRTTDAAVVALKTGLIDFIDWGIDPSYLEEILYDPSVTIFRLVDYGYRYLTFNMRLPEFGYAAYSEGDCGFSNSTEGNYTDIGRPFRVAVAHMIDKKTIVQTYLHEFGTVGTSVISPGNTFWYDPNIYVYGYDPDKANEILDAYAPDSDGNGVRELPNLGEQEMKIETPPNDYDPMGSSEGQLIESLLKSKANLNVRSIPTMQSDLQSEMESHEFQMAISDWDFHTCDESLLSLYYLFSSWYDFKGGSNYPGYHNDTYDRLCMQLMGERNPDRAREIGFELQEAIAWDVPYVVIYYRDILGAYSSAWGLKFIKSGFLNRDMVMNLYKFECDWDVYLDVPSIVEGGKEVRVSAYVYSKDGQPISGAKVMFSVSNGALDENEKVTDEYGRASVNYTPPMVGNGLESTVVNLDVYVYPSPYYACRPKHASIRVIPPNDSMRMKIEIYPERYLNIRDNQSIDFEIKVYGNGRILWPYDYMNRSGVELKCRIFPENGVFRLSGCSNGTWHYLFLGRSHGNITRYVISIYAFFIRGGDTVATAWDNITVNVLPEKNITAGGTGLPENETQGDGVYLLSGTIIAILVISAWIWYRKRKG